MVEKNGAEQQVRTVAPRGMRIAEAARYMAVTPWFVELAIREGRLPALRPGRNYILLREDLDHFLDTERQRLTPQKTASEVSGMTLDGDIVGNEFQIIDRPKLRERHMLSENGGGDESQ